MEAAIGRKRATGDSRAERKGGAEERARGMMAAEPAALADEHLKTDAGRGALQSAVKHGKAALVRTLVAAGVPVDEDDPRLGFTALHAAARKGVSLEKIRRRHV